MKFSTNKNSFLNGVNIVSKAIPTNTTMEILKNIKLMLIMELLNY